MDKYKNFIKKKSLEYLYPSLYIKLYLCYAVFYLCKDFFKLDFPNNYNWGNYL